jgi:hypothetical protein
MKKSWMLVLIILGMVALVAVACSDDGADDARAPETTASSVSQTTSSVDLSKAKPSENPGLSDQDDGLAQAVGILSYRDLEGGFWAVVDTTDAAKAEDADVLAVLGSSDQIPGPIASYEGKYVKVVGRPQGASTYQAGPFLEVQSIEMALTIPEN